MVYFGYALYDYVFFFFKQKTAYEIRLSLVGSEMCIRDLQIRRQMEEPRRQLSHETRKNREKARHMSIGYVTFLMVALVACAFFLVNYIQMQSELTARITEVSRMESELNSLKLANDEEYSRITSNINLEEIKRIAIGELGMTYATEGQVIPYESNSNDYMRQADNSQN